MKAKEFIIELKKESKPRNFVAKNASLAGKAGQHKDKKKAEKQGDVKHKKEIATMESALSELSTEKLAQYKKAAGEDAKKADADGNYSQGDKRFKGINRATNKQFDNDLKKHGVAERVRDPEDWDEGNTEPPNNFAVYINGKKWKVFKGRGRYADDNREQAHYQQLKDWAAKKSASTGKQWTVSITGETATESVEQGVAEVFDGNKETGTTHKGGIVTKTTQGIKHTKTDYDDGHGDQGRKSSGKENRYKQTPILDKDDDVEEASKIPFAGAKVGHKEGPAGQWRNDGAKKNKAAKPGDLVGDGT